MDVLEVVENPKMYKIRIAFVNPPSQNQDPTTLVAVLNAKEEKQFDGLNGNETFSIFVTPNIDATNSVMMGIKRVIKDKNLAAKLFPQYPRSYPQNLINADINNYRRQMAYEMESLFQDCRKPFNKKQKEAIYAMTRSVNTTFVLYGPPGSGKSYTIVEAIRQLLEPPSIFSYQRWFGSSRKILICTPSNMAADAVAEAIIERNFVNSNEVFRLMSNSRDAFSRNHKLDCITRTTVLCDKKNDAICPVYDVPSGDAIKKFNIIICTLGSTPKLSRYLQPGHFSHIFVDEAAQASEMELWLALGHLGTADTRLILAGDPKQLGPVTHVPVLSCDYFGYKSSLIMRLTKEDTRPQQFRRMTFKDDP
uniref:DNA2/NAM7 helicase helicase domain-containing protein n=1 Tax=Panagrolaimus davidi TaxID=227884 RepID=A0A914QAY5_9BILA